MNESATSGAYHVFFQVSALPALSLNSTGPASLPRFCLPFNFSGFPTRHQGNEEDTHCTCKTTAHAAAIA